MHQNVFGSRAPSGHAGELTAFLIPPSWIKWKRRGRREKAITLSNLQKNVITTSLVFTALHCFKKVALHFGETFANFHQNFVIFERSVHDDYYLFTRNAYA